MFTASEIRNIGSHERKLAGENFRRLRKPRAVTAISALARTSFDCS